MSMKCARVRLQERLKSAPKRAPAPGPRRYCQRRLVDPRLNEDPRWLVQNYRLQCGAPEEDDHEDPNCHPAPTSHEDMYLTVQNLKFEGGDRQGKRPRTSFKYKRSTDANKHRMFIKQPVEEPEFDDDIGSQLTCYYYDDYAKYLHTERSRPSSAKSTAPDKPAKRTNKAGQTEAAGKPDKKPKTELKVKIPSDVPTEDIAALPDDTKVTFVKTSKRKSLTISRAPSPETVQVIRVEVVRSYSTSTVSDNEDRKQDNAEIEKFTERMQDAQLKNTRFMNKYLLTSSVKSLDERVSAGEKVTLMCKTYKLSHRNQNQLTKINETSTRNKKFK